MAMISQATIDKIKQASDIVDVVSEYVDLQPAGKSMKGLCPFHNEKTPSFFVSKERQIFNCFGCGEKGDVFGFIRKYKNLTYPEAIEHLADKYNIPLEYDSEVKQIKKKTNFYEINELAQKFYTLNLLNMDSGKSALNYLRSRGLDIQTIEYFELGFAPSDGAALYNKLKSEYPELELINLGLINRNDSGYYDIFRSRIMFPIRNELGRLVAFSGRTFGNTLNPAKYVNTAQTEIFTKGEVIYNLDKATPYINKNDRILLMEGFMDVIAAYKAGMKEAVCSMGTQLTLEQARLIKKFTDNVVICYDGDRAGQEATFKAIKILEKGGLNINIVALPNEMDPDEYIQNNSPEAFRDYVNNNLIDKFDFVYMMITKNLDKNKPSEVEKVKDNLFKYYDQIHSSMIREIYFKRFASEIDISYEILYTDYKDYLLRNRLKETISDKQSKRNIKAVYTKQYTAEKLVINYYLMGEEAFRELIEDKFGLLEFKDSYNLMIIVSLMEQNVTDNYKENVVKLKSSFDPNKLDEIDKRLMPAKRNYVIDELEECLDTLTIAKLQSQIQDINEELSQISYSENKEKYNDLSSKKIEIKKQIMKIEGRTHGTKASSRFFEKTI